MSAVTSKLTRYGDLPAKLCVDVTGPEWAELKRGDRQLIFHIQNQRAIQAYVPPLVATLLGMGAEAPIALEPFSLHADRKSVGTVPVMQHFSFNLSDFLPATITGGPLCAQLALYGVERCPSEIRAEQVLVSITQERIPR
jgi:hypothetical protein